jgi:DNA modification methylase
MDIIDQIFNQDCIQGMRSLPDGCVNTCITSPPYYGLRDYGHDGQIGLEESPEAYVQKMVEVFREVKRVLRDDGTLWLNLGDSYAGNNSQASNNGRAGFGNPREKVVNRTGEGLKTKDLIGIPWRVAFALQADGWYLRQDIIWHKPNPMPESVTDRCTKAHEYIFLLSKSSRYYFDSEAIKEDANYAGESRGKSRNISPKGISEMDNKIYDTRNKRSVWTITTKPFKDAHFATYPEDLIVPCILAGCPEGGLVLDPFMGAGTTALVSKKLGRNYVGFELNEEYKKIADKRLNKTLGIFAL